MMMGVRLQELFNLMSQNEYRSATYFAQRLNVSLKTVRNDIKKLDCIFESPWRVDRIEGAQWVSDGGGRAGSV